MAQDLILPPLPSPTLAGGVFFVWINHFSVGIDFIRKLVTKTIVVVYISYTMFLKPMHRFCHVKEATIIIYSDDLDWFVCVDWITSFLIRLGLPFLFGACVSQILAIS